MTTIAYAGLIAFLGIAWYLSFYIDGYHLLAPTSLGTLAILVGGIFAFVGVSTWNTSELGFKTVSIVIVGTSSYVAGGYFARKLMAAHKKRQLVKRDNRFDAPDRSNAGWLASGMCHTAGYSFHVATWKLVAFTLVILAAAIIRIHETVKLGVSSGIHFSSYMELAQWVRWTYSPIFSEGNVQFGVGYSVVARQMLKILFVGGYVSSFYLGYNLGNKGLKKEIVFFTVCFMLCCSCTFLEGERATIFGYFVAVLASSFIRDVRYGQNPLRISIKYCKVITVALVVAFAVFYALGKLIGRVGSSGPIEYITFYFGCGIPSMQEALNTGLNLSTSPGSQTFAGLYDLLYKFHLMELPAGGSNLFVTLGGKASNIYTQYYGYYCDFGFAGVAVFPMLSSVILSLIYRVSTTAHAPWCTLLYPAICGYIVDQVRGAFVFSVLFSLSWIVSYILLSITVCLLFYQKTATSRCFHQLRDESGKSDIVSD